MVIKGESYANEDGTLNLPHGTSLNAEGLENKPVCPVCTGYLENASNTYILKRMNTDTRWFYCSSCEGHLGYHRMKANWRVDPYDLDTSSAFKEFFGIVDEG